MRALQQFFDKRIAPLASSARASTESEHRLRLATAALFIETERADFRVTDAERRKLETAVRDTLELDDEETRELIALAEQEVDASVELFQFTRLIDQAFTPEQKVHLVERLWRVALADAQVDSLEEHLVRKIANLLHVSHRDYIAAKRRARMTARS
ncbi:MAG TPA: TerB family tellurite resistance protein [Thermoanaerobaculia bacterium]|nr:TerB family tellurite resistance protein [Thermoanaerobaculia bacterium]